MAAGGDVGVTMIGGRFLTQHLGGMVWEIGVIVAMQWWKEGSGGGKEGSGGGKEGSGGGKEEGDIATGFQIWEDTGCQIENKYISH